MMTGREGLFAGGDMVPCGTHRDRGRRPRQEGGAQHRRLAQRRQLSTSPARSTSWPPSKSSTPGTTPTRRKRVQPISSELVRRQSGFDEVLQGLTEDNALFEARRCLSCGNCFECDNCYGICPDNAVIKLGPRQPLRIQLRLLQGLRHVRRRMPVRRDHHGAGSCLSAAIHGHPAGKRFAVYEMVPHDRLELPTP